MSHDVINHFPEQLQLFFFFSPHLLSVFHHWKMSQALSFHGFPGFLQEAVGSVKPRPLTRSLARPHTHRSRTASRQTCPCSGPCRRRSACSSHSLRSHTRTRRCCCRSCSRLQDEDGNTHVTHQLHGSDFFFFFFLTFRSCSNKVSFDSNPVGSCSCCCRFRLLHPSLKHFFSRLNL